jgi:hypothetical protein
VEEEGGESDDEKGKEDGEESGYGEKERKGDDEVDVTLDCIGLYHLRRRNGVEKGDSFFRGEAENEP